MSGTEDGERGFYSGRGGVSSPGRGAAETVQGFRYEKRTCAVRMMAALFGINDKHILTVCYEGEEGVR